MYPTATRNPGPAKAIIFRQKLAVFGTARERCTSGKLGVSASRRHGLVSGFIPKGALQFTARARTDEHTATRVLYTHTSMKVLVIGGGGREHAIAWKLRQSTRITQLICTPGNGGIADEAECLPGDVKDIPALVALAQKLGIDLTVVGPEVPLNLGIVDEFQKRGLRIFGPTKAAAQLESSKSFAKEFMQRHNVPTPHKFLGEALAALEL